MTNKPQAKVLKKERVFDGFFKLDSYEIEMEKHEGGKQVIKRLVFERGHSVAMLGYDPARDEVLMSNEMRPGILAAGEYPFQDSVPAGSMDKGESAIESAKREMLEETGQELKEAVLIHDGAYVSEGGTSEKIALVVGIVDTSKAHGVHGKVSEGESIKVFPVAANDFIQRANDGKLKDMKSLVFAFWLANNRQKLQERYIAKKASDMKGPR